jgi:hypothetical protein
MAHWAEVNKSNVVLRVLVTDNRMPNEGLDWLQGAFGGTWLQTSYNTQGGKHLTGGTSFRGNFAGVGMTYDTGLDAFLFPKKFDSWLINQKTYYYEPPTAYPIDGETYEWNEPTISWVEIPQENTGE